MLWVVDTCWKVFLTFMLLCSPLTTNKSSSLTVQEWEVVFFSFHYSAVCATVAKENERKSYLLQALDGVETQDLRGERFRKGQQRCRCICDLESLVKSLLGWKLWAFFRINMSSVIIKLKKMPKGKGKKKPSPLELCIWKLFSPLRKYLWLFVPVKEENVLVNFTQERTNLCTYRIRKE